MTVRLITPEMRENFRHLYWDIFWYGILSGSTLSFLAIFATRLGATGFQVSLLTAGPAVVNLLVSLPAARWMEGKPLIPVSFWGGLLQRFGYLALMFIPWLFAEHLQVWAVILFTLLLSIPGTVIAISFNAMFADVVPPEWRGDVVGRRNALIAASQTATALLCGQILDLKPLAFPLNYQVVFGLGAAGAMLSAYHVSRLRMPGQPPVRVGLPIRDAARPVFLRIGDVVRQTVGLRFLLRASGRPLLRLDLLRSSYGRFLGVFLFFYFAQYAPLPLFPLVFVRQIRLTDSAISLGTALFNATMFLGSLYVGRLSARHGHRRLMIVSAIFYSLYPLFIGLARSALLYWVGSLVGGVVWSIASAGLVNRLMERVPENERPPYMALHNLALNIGILSGSLAGSLLANWIGLQEAVLLSAGLRFLAGVLLLFWG